jgi:hypothetical protein
MGRTLIEQDKLLEVGRFDEVDLYFYVKKGRKDDWNEEKEDWPPVKVRVTVEVLDK